MCRLGLEGLCDARRPACNTLKLLHFASVQHLQIVTLLQLAANVDFTFETGRKSVLEMLHACAREFADDVLQAYSDTILLALVTRLVNEPSRSVKAMVVQLIRQLVVRAPKQQVGGGGGGRLRSGVGVVIVDV